MRDANAQTFQCEECSASYSRREHLKRHQRSHTQGRPYQCAICQKRFSRRDVLNRHAHLHDLDRSSNFSQARVLGSRVGRACTECSAKKVRCDGTLPCVSCVSKNKAEACLYPGTYVPHTGIHHEELALRELDAGHTLINLQDNRLSQASDPDYQQVTELLLPQDFMNPPSLTQEQHAHVPSTLPTTVDQDPELSTDHTVIMPAVGDEMQVNFTESSDFQKSFDLDMAFYPYTYDLGIADSAMDWLNLPDFDLGMDSGMTPGYRASRAQTRQGTRQGTPIGNRSSESEEETMLEGESDWPTDWQPTTHSDLGLPPVILTETQFDEGNTMQVKTINNEARNNLYTVLQDIGNYYPISIDIGNFPDVKVTNVLIQLYFEHFHPLWPIFHKATIDVSRTSSVVLLAILTIGCRYQAPGLALGLSELLRRAIQVSCERDNTLVRSLGINQSLLISQVSGIFQGNKRTLEISESMRGHLVTHTRRSRFIDNRAFHDVPLASPCSGPGQDDLQQRWLDWRHKEERKRIGLAAWISDCAFASSFNMLPMMSVSELQCPLPCDEALWDAPTEVAWKSKFLASRLPPEPASIQQSINNLLDGQVVHTNAWGRCILLLCLYRVTWQESHYRNDNKAARRDQICRAFDLVIAPVSKAPMYRQGELLYHALQLELHAPMMNLHSLAGRRTLIEGDIALQQVQNWATRNISMARKALYHAAWIYHNLANTPINSTDEPIAAFNSALVIWGFVKFAPQKTDSTTNDFVISAHMPPDCDFLQSGGRITIQGIGSAAEKLDQILLLFADCLSGMSVWLISQSYAQILRQFANVQLEQAKI